MLLFAVVLLIVVCQVARSVRRRRSRVYCDGVHAWRRSHRLPQKERQSADQEEALFHVHGCKPGKASTLLVLYGWCPVVDGGVDVAGVDVSVIDVDVAGVDVDGRW